MTAAVFICIPKAHDQSGKAKFLCLYNQVFVLKAKVIAAPSVSKLIIRGTVCLKTGVIMYESGNDQSCMLGLYVIVGIGKTFSAKLQFYIFG